MMSQFGLDASEPHLTSKEAGYQSEIASMMHGFGDNPVPNDAAVALVESIVLQQLILMVQEATKTAELRNSKYSEQNKVITNTDMVYLFRNNKMKLKRLHDYFKTSNMMKQHKVNSDPSLIDNSMEDEGSQSSGIRYGGRVNTLDAIYNIDTTGEVKCIDYDDVKYARAARAAKLTESMSLEKYEAYYKARLVSFGKPGFAKTQQKFKTWLNPNNEYNIGQSAYDILVYLAFETVAELVDLVFLVRQDAKKRSDDPFSKYSAGNFCNPVSLSNAVYIKSGNEGVPQISVAEIREVMRRVYTPRAGVSGMFYRNMRNELPPKFIAI